MTSSDNSSFGRATQRRVARLKYRNREYTLDHGQHVIGRAPGCLIVLDEPLVSRRHAEINVGPERTTLRDLDSVNGVFVNGRQITGLQTLQQGDRITIGRQDLEFTYGSEAPAAPKFSGFSAPRPPSSRPHAGSNAGETTKQADALELIGIVADKALEAGRTTQAEEMLKMHLKQVLDGARTGRPMTDATARAGVKNSLKLAIATGKGSWFDYASELLSLKAIPCSDAVAELLRQAVTKVDKVHAAQIENYVRSQRTEASSLDQLRSAQKLDEVARIAKTKRNFEV